MKIILEGDEKSKQAKIKFLKHKFEKVKISNDKKIQGYIHLVNEIINALRSTLVVLGFPKILRGG